VKTKHPRPTADVEIIGARTRFIAVLGRIVEERSWLRGMPECALLAAHNIAHTGVLDARRPYEIVRIDQSGTFMLACLEGEGVVMVDGSWKKISEGQACLLPPFVMNSLKCTGNKTWRFAWVRYEESRDAKPIVSSVSPVIGAFDGSGLGAAITGLRQEAVGENNPAALHQWCELVHHYVTRFAEPSNLDERLWRLWSAVEKNPSHDWTLGDFAEIACLSAEHLRRLCLREIGRSPMRHLTFIRLQLAVNLLSTTGDKIETIALEVGFSGIHSFSNAFRARFGRPPSDFR
jgi:AraC-like DNA-binding protein